MWHQLASKLRPFVARRVPSADVEDVLQDALLRVQLGLPGLRDPSRLEPWTYQAARSAVGSYWEVRHRHPLPSGDEPEPAEESEPEEPDESARRCMARYLLAQVTELPPPYREALVLTELQGLTQQEAAALAGISLPGMKSRVRRARLLLRQRAEACCRLSFDGRARVVECEARQSDCSC